MILDDQRAIDLARLLRWEVVPASEVAVGDVVVIGSDRVFRVVSIVQGPVPETLRDYDIWKNAPYELSFRDAEGEEGGGWPPDLLVNIIARDCLRQLGDK